MLLFLGRTFWDSNNYLGFLQGGLLLINWSSNPHIWPKINEWCYFTSKKNGVMGSYLSLVRARCGDANRSPFTSTRAKKKSRSQESSGWTASQLQERFSSTRNVWVLVGKWSMETMVLNHEDLASGFQLWTKLCCLLPATHGAKIPIFDVQMGCSTISPREVFHILITRHLDHPAISWLTGGYWDS